MKKTISLLALTCAVCFFAACDNPPPPPLRADAPPPPPPPKPPAPETGARPGDKKPAGVPKKVFNQVKGIEHQRNDNLQHQLDNM